MIKPIEAAATPCRKHQPNKSTLMYFISLSYNITTGYAPIRFHGNSKVDLTLDYSFFYDLELQTQEGDINQPINTGAGERRRRRRQNVDPDAELGETIQSVNISFRPVEVGNGVLLYSRTRSSVHLLKV